MKPDRIDWAQILRDLEAIGFSPVAVADHLKIARSTPYRWIEGSEPLYSHGASLLVFHASKIRHSETQAEQSQARETVDPQGADHDRADHAERGR